MNTSLGDTTVAVFRVDFPQGDKFPTEEHFEVTIDLRLLMGLYMRAYRNRLRKAISAHGSIVVKRLER